MVGRRDGDRGIKEDVRLYEEVVGMYIRMCGKVEEEYGDIGELQGKMCGADV